MANPITALPTPPSTSDPANFDSRADNFLGALPDFADELNDLAASLNSLSTTTASTSSVAIGTGTKNFTVESGKSLFAGMSYRIAYDANNWMNGEIISYDSGTGALSVDVDVIRGAGTYAAWVGTLSFNGEISTEQLAPSIFNGLTTVTFDPAADYVAIADGSESGNKKKALLPDASETAKGLVELLSEAEYEAGTDAARVLTAAVARSGNIVSGTAIASTSGTSIDFTGIPAWPKRISIEISGLSTNGSSIPIIQIGDSGGIETSGYLASAAIIAATPVLAGFTSGFGIAGQWAAATVGHLTVVLSLLDASTNTWSAVIAGGVSSSALTLSGGGSKSLSAILDRVRLTTVGGADTFDAGSINILYE